MFEENNITEYKDRLDYEPPKKRNNRGVKFFKIICFLLVAVLSGIIGSYAVVSSKLKDLDEYKQIQANNNTNTNVSLTSSKTWGNTITKVAEEVSPSVVGITSIITRGNWEVAESSGSGIILSKDGFIVTNNHVIEGGSNIKVKTSDEKTYDAKVVGQDPRTDLAVIKIQGNNFKPAKIGDSSKMKVGDLAIAIGNPEGFYGSVTSGIISATNRMIKAEGSEYKAIQTDAAINHGNSGGALVNANGEVIGINSLKLGKDDAEGLGFAITTNSAKTIIDSLKKYGDVSRPALGITGGQVQTRDGKVTGILIREITPNTGAEKAGVLPGDIIVEADGKKTTDIDRLREIIQDKKIGDTIKLKVWRDNKTFTLNVKLTDSSKILTQNNKIG